MNFRRNPGKNPGEIPEEIPVGVPEGISPAISEGNPGRVADKTPEDFRKQILVKFRKHAAGELRKLFLEIF